MPSDFDKLVKLTEKIVKQEKELSNQNSKLLDILDNTTDGYWDWHIKEDYEYMSPKFWEILGHDHKTKKHKPSEWMSLMEEEQLDIAMQEFKNHVDSKGKKPYRCKLEYKHPEGHKVIILCKGKVVEWDEDGQPIRMVGTHTDITDIDKG